MKRIVVLAMLFVLWGILPAQGADFQINPQFQAVTGDSDFDFFLKNVNIVASQKISVFITDLCSSYNVPVNNLNFLIYTEKIQPADVFMILQVVKISGKPYEEVITQFKKYRNKGWGAIALSCGIKPGSRTFLLLKEEIPLTIVKYKETVVKGSKVKKGSKAKKGSKGKKGSKKHK